MISFLGWTSTTLILFPLCLFEQFRVSVVGRAPAIGTLTCPSPNFPSAFKSWINLSPYWENSFSATASSILEDSFSGFAPYQHAVQDRTFELRCLKLKQPASGYVIVRARPIPAPQSTVDASSHYELSCYGYPVYKRTDD